MSSRACRLLFACLVASGATSLPETKASPAEKSLDQWIETIAGAEADEEKRHLVYELRAELETGALSIPDAASAGRLAGLMADLMSDAADPHLAQTAGAFLAKHPHPAASDALADAARKSDVVLRSYAIRALVSLRDRRALPLLLEELGKPRTSPHRGTLRLLAELGDPGALAPLEQRLNEVDLESAFETAILEDPHAPSRFKAEAPARAVELAAAEREATRQALRDLRLSVEANMTCTFPLDDRTHQELARTGFAIRPVERVNEMYELYFGDFAVGAYPFVTTDLAFHSFLILVRASLDELERLVLRPRIGALSLDLVRASLRQASELEATPLADLAHQNAAFLAVPAVLLNDIDLSTLELPRRWEERARQEIERIRRHEGVARSAVFEIEEDYTKYKPRGRHGADPKLAGYFQGMLWYGRMILRRDSIEETEQAILLLDLFARNPGLRDEWEDLDRLLGLFFGERDDPALPDYDAAARVVLAAAPVGPSSASRLTLALDRALFDRFRAELAALPEPRINTAFIRWPMSMEWKTRAHGFRLFGQRYTRSIHLFQEYMNDIKWPPSALFIAAELLGSGVAREILELEEDFDAVPRQVSDPYANLTEAYLHCARAIFEVEDEAPPFMADPAWERKSINAALGAWAELRHSTMLYDKDANMYLCESLMVDRFHGYVEPVPRLYARLDSALTRVREALSRTGLFERIDEDRGAARSKLEEWRQKRGKGARSSLTGHRAYREARARQEALAQDTLRVAPEMFDELSEILGRFEEIALKELGGEGQSIDDGLFLKGLGRRLKQLAFNHSNSDHARVPMALISDAATEWMRGECLEVGVGFPAAIYVAVPDGERTFVCKGAVYTYYEFTQPISDRLDDEQWRQLLATRGGSSHRPWIETILAPSVHDPDGSGSTGEPATRKVVPALRR